MRVTIDLMKKSTQIIDLSNVINPRVGDDDLLLPLHIIYGDNQTDMRGKDVEFLSNDPNKKNIYIAGTCNTNTPGDNLYMGDLTFRFPAGTFKADGTYDPDKTMFRIVDKETQKVISSVNVKVTVMKSNIEFDFDPDNSSYDSRLETMLHDFHDKGQTMLDEIKDLNNQANSNVSGDTATTAKEAKKQADQNAGDISDLKGEVAGARGRFANMAGREDAQDAAINQKESIANANANYAALQQKNTQQDSALAQKAGKFELEDKLAQMNLQPEMYADLNAVNAAYPNGATKLIATDDGYLALYRNNQWVKGPVFQSSGLADGIVHTRNTNFAVHQVDVFKGKDTLIGIYNVTNNAIVYQNASVNKHYGDFTCFKFKANPNEHTYTVSGTDFNIFGSTEDGTLAWSDNNVDGVNGPYTFTVPGNVVWVYVNFLTANYDKYHCFVGDVHFDETGRFLLDAPLASPISDGIVTPETTTFIEGRSNLFDAFNSMNGIYNIANGKIAFQNASINKHYGDFTCFKFKVNPNEHTYTVSDTDFNIFGSTEDGTLAWSDNNVDGVTGPYTFTVPDNVVWVYVTFLTKRIKGYKAVVGKDLGQVGYRLSDKIEVPNKGALQVHVGKGYQYEHLIDAVNSINPDKDNVYTIYLHDTSDDYTGTTFDLLEELGGTNYLATIENAKDNMQGFHLPPYVNLVGVGKVILKAELPDDVTFNQSANFSTIEIEQGNNALRNLMVKVKNGRYPVHDESRDKYPNATHDYDNVIFIHEGNASGLWQAPHAYAAGTSGGSHYSYTNCIFDATESGGYPFDLHNYAPQEGVTVEADGVQLLSNKNQQYVMRFGFNGYSPLTTDQVKYAACFNDVFLKNVLGVGSVLVEPEDSSYSCTNNYRIHNFTNLNLDIKNNQIKA
ncbi:hypothetical protein [Limosilactobacillus reuteri]|uniref:BppU N-terminal domain-containing protein n=1 Tax=Limosilactobacillus reuteri TaxID=1598 RepID=A0AAW8ZZK1_LIMRT|nr:hypothetical protein [Limosilactobacillus reuteri]MDV8945900.1 hypothetical protein [Limosilactobacillus reuteri]